MILLVSTSYSINIATNYVCCMLKHLKVDTANSYTLTKESLSDGRATRLDAADAAVTRHLLNVVAIRVNFCDQDTDAIGNRPSKVVP
jgi:hypothetical protein